MDRWCAEWSLARGAIITVPQLWRLARAWYAGRLDENWAPRTPEAAQAIFETVGLTGEFWRVT